MADFNINFGVKTRSGYGGGADTQSAAYVGETPGSAITGTGAADWVIDSDGAIVPSGTYGNAKTFSKAAGETYNLTLNSGATCDITLIANRADITIKSTDTVGSNQLRKMLTLTWNSAGALRLGDTLILRDGTVYFYNFADVSGGNSVSISTPSGGYGGSGTILNGGTGYTTGYYSVTGGSGTDAKLYLVTSGGVVTHVAVYDPGIGYQSGDTVSVAGGGSGFSFQITDLAAEITIRSETANTSTLADGNLRRGGNAIIGQLMMNPSAPAYCPYHFKYIDWLVTTPTRARSAFFEYRGTSGFGVSFSYNYVAVPDEYTIDTTTNADKRMGSFQTRHGRCEYNYFYRTRNCATRLSGIGVWDASQNLFRVPDDTVMRTYFQHNVCAKNNGDSFAMNGTKNHFNDNLVYESLVLGNSHQDFFQHTGFGDHGGTLTDVLECRRNIYVRGNIGSSTYGGAQGIFCSDTNPPTLMAGIVMRNNIILGGSPNSLVIPASLDPDVAHNTVINALTFTDGATGQSARIYIKEGQGGVIDRNATNQVYVDEVGKEQVGITVSATNSVITDRTTYAAYFASPAFEGLRTVAAVKAAWAAVQDGSAKNLDGTYNGALFPDQTFNDGTVYNATPPSSITQSAASSVTVNQPLTITYQLDAAANATVTVTPGVTGVTGSFSSATVTISPGQSSAQVTFTPTSAGTATLSATDDLGLTGPSNINVTVNAAVTGPTSYTQTLNHNVITVTQTIQITYTLNEPATEAVTITPASSLDGVFSAATVTIPFGQTSASVTFSPNRVGSGSFTATDDLTLTDPGGASFTVARMTQGQLLRLRAS